MKNEMTPFTIDPAAFNDEDRIEARVHDAPNDDQGALRSALRYLYLDDGPVNLPKDRMRTALSYLDDAEQKVVKWLQTRTNGNLRSSYGAKALQAARTAQCRCERCGFSDVRVLNLDHIDGRAEGTEFACLCASCHTIKSLESGDWSGA